MPVTIEQRGLFYEELQIDATYRHAPGRTLGESDNTLFSTLTMNRRACTWTLKLQRPRSSVNDWSTAC